MKESKNKMTKTRRTIFILGRVLFGLIFLVAGIKKILYWHAIEESVAVQFCALSMHFPGIGFFEHLLRFVPLFLGVATFLELFGALILMSGYLMRLGAIFLLIFLIPATILYHDFWLHVGDKRMLEMSMFMKNLALIGGLLLLSLNPNFKKQKK